jgi:hypothetical protein
MRPLESPNRFRALGQRTGASPSCLKSVSPPLPLSVILSFRLFEPGSGRFRSGVFQSAFHPPTDHHDVVTSFCKVIVAAATIMVNRKRHRPRSSRRRSGAPLESCAWRPVHRPVRSDPLPTFPISPQRAENTRERPWALRAKRSQTPTLDAGKDQALFLESLEGRPRRVQRPRVWLARAGISDHLHEFVDRRTHGAPTLTLLRRRASPVCPGRRF